MAFYFVGIDRCTQVQLYYKKEPPHGQRPVRNVLPRWKGGTNMFMVIVSTLGGILKAVMVVLVIAACIKYLRQK